MKVLIIRFSSIGDIVLTTPVIRCLSEQTGAEIHFLTKVGFASLLSANPYISKLWTIEKEVTEVLPGLLAEAYNHVIDLHANLRTLALRTQLFSRNTLHRRPRPKWHSFDKLNLEKYLLVNVKINRLPDLHIVDRYLAAAKKLGVSNDGNGLDYFIPESEKVTLAEENLPANYLAFVIGAAHATKRLTVAQMTAFCALLPYPILLLGGPAERETGDQIAEGLTNVTNVCGRFKLGGSADIIRQAQAVVSHDTGMMHVAAAFRKPILSIWGNTIPAFGMYPYLPDQALLEKERREEVKGLSCRPCSKIGYQQCPRGHFRCIKDQSPTTLAAAAMNLLQAEEK